MMIRMRCREGTSGHVTFDNTLNDSSSQMRIYKVLVRCISSTIFPFMPRRSLGKTIPAVPQVIDVLENGTERKYIFYYAILMQLLIIPNLVDRRRLSLRF